ncbi:hypothetical protein C8Q77DRAFT_500076 [Trametes polyzona]|nr:hypothetical protein C8Q77DRAFT_500076 [Trametes polyzona]
MADGRLLATMVDGRVRNRQLNTRPIRELRSDAIHLRELSFTHLPAALVAYPAFRELMSSSMPFLEVLKIEVQADSQHQVNVALDLSLQRLPSLHTLTLKGALAAISPSIAPRLRCLVLKQHRGYPGPLSVAQVLEFLSNLTVVEELTICNCLGNQAPVDDNGGAVLPAAVGNLQKLTIQDDAPTISLILSQLIVPVNAHVYLRPLTMSDFSTATCTTFLEALPPDRSCLPILECVSCVRVSCSLGDYTIQAKTACEGSVTFALDHNAPALNTLNGCLVYPRRGLFHQMLSSAPQIFRKAPITHLSCRGILEDLSEPMWLSVLANFPGLRDLQVKDAVYYSSAIPLLSALMMPSPLTHKPVCRSLEYLTLYSRMCGVDLLQKVHQCFAWRQAHPEGWGGIIASIQIHAWTSESSSSPLLVSYVDRYREAFRSYAGECKITLVPAALLGPTPSR